jgi:hypothetical protein
MPVDRYLVSIGKYRGDCQDNEAGDQGVWGPRINVRSERRIVLTDRFCSLASISSDALI